VETIDYLPQKVAPDEGMTIKHIQLSLLIGQMPLPERRNSLPLERDVFNEFNDTWPRISIPIEISTGFELYTLNRTNLVNSYRYGKRYVLKAT
jgi:hypothetical protein